MNLDQNAKDAVQSLSEAINSAVEKSFAVRDAIEHLRELGYEPVLTLKLEIGLQEMNGNADGFAEDLELSLTDEDVRTLQRMKIRF
jgi:hypothetical protein